MILRTALLAAAAFACVIAPASLKAAAKIHAAYVLFADSPKDGTVLLARVILDAGSACPALRHSGKTITMSVRRNPNPRTFPVIVCEARYPFGQAVTITGSPLRLPRVTRNPKRVIVFGDTGCKGLDKAGKGQNCKDPKAWPFKHLAKSAAESSPELVIHVGDYNYIGTPGKIPFARKPSPRHVFDAGDFLPVTDHCQRPGGYVSQNAAGSLLPDSWKNWRRDFFAPARPLLLAAPWVTARGNHDLCSRAGPGWFYFLGPRSPLLGDGVEQLSCPSEPQSSPLVYVPPYRLDVGPMDLVVMDTSKACDITYNTKLTTPYVAQFERLRRLVRDKPTWLVMHRPIWAVVAPAHAARHRATAAPDAYSDINKTLQRALRLGAGGSLPASIKLVVAGHMHRFQSLTFASSRPPILIVGDSGFELVRDGPTGVFTASVDGTRANGLSEDIFGYLDMRLGQKGTWDGEMVHRRPGDSRSIIAECGTSHLAKGSICTLRRK